MPAGELTIAGSLGRFGLELGGGLEGDRQQVRAEGTVYASQRWLRLAATFEQPLGSRFAIAAALGVQGWNLTLGARGFTTASTRTAWGVGPALSMGPSLSLGSLRLMLKVTGALRFPEQRLVVDGLGELMLLKTWQVGVLAGAGWRFP